MPNSKLASIRELIVDRCLSSGKFMSTREIWNEVNKELISRGDNPVKYSGTIVDDITFIASKAKVEIEEYMKGRTKYHRYKDPNFSLYLTPAKLAIIRRVNQLIEILNDFKGLPALEWVEDFKARLKATAFYEVDDTPIVTFSFNPDYTHSLRHFAPLYDCIKTKTAIELTYKKFTDEAERTYVVHPYHLKEFQNRWYLYATVDHHPDSVACYAFDRIIGFKKSDKKYIENTRYDFKTYFNQMVGVAIYPDMVPEEVLLWVKKKEYPYLKTNPIHPSQKYVKDTEDGMIISLNLYINYELEMRILSYGEGVKVLAPDHFANKLKERIEKLKELYEDSLISVE